MQWSAKCWVSPCHIWCHFQVKKLVEAFLQSLLPCAMVITFWLPNILLSNDKNVIPGWLAFPNWVQIAMEKLFLGAIFSSTPACLLHFAINRALLVAAWVVVARISVWKTIKLINTDHGVSKWFFDTVPHTVCIQAIRLHKIALWSWSGWAAFLHSGNSTSDSAATSNSNL